MFQGDKPYILEALLCAHVHTWRLTQPEINMAADLIKLS